MAEGGELPAGGVGRALYRDDHAHRIGSPHDPEPPAIDCRAHRGPPRTFAGGTPAFDAEGPHPLDWHLAAIAVRVRGGRDLRPKTGTSRNGLASIARPTPRAYG